MMLLRPNYTKLDPFFWQKRGGLYISEQGFFLGNVVHFLGPWDRFSKNGGGFPKKEGGFYALEFFSNVILRDMLAVK